MTKARRFCSLKVKMLYAVMVAIALGSAAFLIVWLTGNRALDRCVLTDQAMNQKTQSMLSNLQDYVSKNSIASTDTDALKQWCQKQKNVSITIYRNTDNYDEEEAEGFQSLNGSISDLENASELTLYSVVFSDGTFTVSVFDYSADVYFQLLLIASITVFFITLLAVILVYTRRITNRISWLSGQAIRVSHGDSAISLNLGGNDEISSLATNFDEMKQSLLRQLKQEEHAWKSNQELITSISHDLRNPLTILMGYTELLDSPQCDHDYKIRKKYLKICKDNASHLKTLTDELFGYFLVFGNSGVAVHEQSYNAQILLEQLLGEEIAPLKNENYDIHTEFELENCTLKTDIVLLKRIVSNLFSNMRKYADSSQVVTICACQADATMQIEFQNYIRPESTEVESTQIGLKTCSRLAEILNGTFCYFTDDRIFTAKLTLPLDRKV